jgi:mono/diheme cytochrome c family protein
VTNKRVVQGAWPAPSPKKAMPQPKLVPGVEQATWSRRPLPVAFAHRYSCHVEQKFLSTERPRRFSLILVPLCVVVLLVATFAIVKAPWQKAQNGAVAQLAPVVPGLHGRHPLDQAQIGGLLIGELGCTACHEQLQPLISRSKAAPDLHNVGWRVSPEFLHRFIADPAAAQPGTTMPQVLAGMSHDKREKIAEAISQFLISRSSATFHRDSVEQSDLKVGGELFHTVGCVACHAPRDAAIAGTVVPTKLDGAVGLQHLPDKYSLASLSQFLLQPLNVRASGRMPDMGLHSAAARSIASYLLGTENAGPKGSQAQPSLVDAGREYFQTYNCAACHSLEGVKALPPVVQKDRLDPMRGCLADKPDHVPDFSLGQDQRAAMRSALLAGDDLPTASDQVAVTLTAFNCIGCHVRDNYGGVPAELNLYFKTSEPSLGEDARIPPPLTEIGAKLKPEWFLKVMFDAASVRPYMHTHMPQFGEANLAFLASLIESADPAIPYQMPHPKGAQAKVAREAGHALLGADTLGCINCHAFNGKPSPGFSGLDLITSIERLRPEWFSRFLVEPQHLRPGILMPQAWPGGIASRTDILDGDTKAQLEAIWFFLSQGRSAQDPQGIHSEPTILKVEDTARTYRGRSQIAGFRGIAVGFPSGLSYAFNAQTGTLSGIWRGGFVRVRWDGQGAGDFNPSGRAIALAQDVSFCKLANDQAPWPLRPQMDEENPVNPDPLYPHNHGYQFGGYYFDQASVPTFLYRVGSVAIEDSSIADPADQTKSLSRSLRFSAPAAETLYFRALTGKIEQENPGRFKTDTVRLTIPSVTTLLRPLAGEDQQSELILIIEIPKGESTLVIHYEVLD